MQTSSRDWRSTLLSSLLSAIAVCCGVLSIAQSSAPVPADNAGPRWTAAAPAVNDVSLDLVAEWARTAPDVPRLSADDPANAAGDSDDDDDGDNDDAPGVAVAPPPTTLTADRGHTQLTAPQEIGRRLSPTSDGHSLRAPPQ